MGLNKFLITNMRIIQRSVHDRRKRETCETILDTLSWLDPPTFTTFTYSTHNLNKLLILNNIHSHHSQICQDIIYFQSQSSTIKILLKMCQKNCPSKLLSISKKIKKVWSPNHSALLSISLGICLMSTLPNSIS